MKKNKQKELKINRRELLAGSASLGAIALSSKIGYSKETNPNKGLAVARMAAHITYLSKKGLQEKASVLTK